MILKDAKLLAAEVIQHLEPLCLLHQGETQEHVLCCVAGSVRRGKLQMIKDVEIVYVPDTTKLQEVAKLLNTKWGEPAIGRFPSLYTKIRGRYNVDLFCCTRETFGMNYFIRTGPDSFCRRFLATWKEKTNGGYSNGAILHLSDGTVVPTPTELSVFNALGWKFVRPEHRV
jgi:DNA polymerase/3'-5' exonuclease PolX